MQVPSKMKHPPENLEGVFVSEQESGLSKSYLDYQIQITDNYPEPVPILSQGDTAFLTRGNVIMINAKAKSMKSYLATALATSILEDDVLGINGKGNSVLYIDTEQSKSHVCKLLKRIYRLAGLEDTEPDNRITVLALRELNVEERRAIIYESVRTIKPSLVIIDGIRDLVHDINDIKECSPVVGEIMALSSEFDNGIVVILHTNKNDNNARGHIGSELSNKCETVLQVVNDSGIATVTPVYSRNKEIESFSFRINHEGLPEGCHLPKDEKKAGKKSKELNELMTRAMSGISWISKKDLTDKVHDIIKPKGRKTAQRRIDEAIEAKIIKENNTGHLIMNNQIFEPDELPF